MKKNLALFFALILSVAQANPFLPDEQNNIETYKKCNPAVVNITAVLTEMKQLGKFDIVSYHDRAKILNIEEKVKRRVELMKAK